MNSGEAFIFDVCSFYGHNKYDTGNWRTPRHRLSKSEYIENYKKLVPASEPEEDWNARNILYSLPFNIGNAIYNPGSTQKPVIYDDMVTLCTMFCPDYLQREISALHTSQNKMSHLENLIDVAGRDIESRDHKWDKDRKKKIEGENEEVGGSDMMKPEPVRVEVDTV
ncbi:hypothetical protein V492_06592 [Pseudogymnoascus sp. VKM F-4246]|nr:hypothetical protein V492_06592 [Pseudogymnoascus sp. VKM F-4246]